MIALVDIAGEPPGFLRGRFSSGITVRSGNVLGVPSAYITLAPVHNIAAERRRLKAAEKLLCRAGAGTVFFPEGFAYAEHFYSRGFNAPGVDELYGAMSAKAAALLVREGSAAYLYAPRLSVAADRVLEALCRTCRLVMAEIPSDGTRFLALQRRLGVSIVERPPPGMLREAEVAFILGTPNFEAALPGSCVVYAVSENALRAVRAARYVSGLKVALPEDMTLPDGYLPNPLIAEALRGMTMGGDTITLSSVEVSDFALDKTPDINYNYNLN